MAAALCCQAAEPGVQSGGRDAYRSDRAACLDGRTNQDRDTCLREAGAARDAAKRGQLGEGSDAFEKNRLARCEGLPQPDREDCIRRMSGEGTTRGSVESGGIYRELVTPVPPPRN
jgi:hypothetical protein